MGEGTGSLSQGSPEGLSEEASDRGGERNCVPGAGREPSVPGEPWCAQEMEGHL